MASESASATAADQRDDRGDGWGDEREPAADATSRMVSHTRREALLRPPGGGGRPAAGSRALHGLQLRPLNVLLLGYARTDTLLRRVLGEHAGSESQLLAQLSAAGAVSLRSRGVGLLR